MPYISKSDRPQYNEVIEQIAALIPQDHSKRPGHINYLVTSILRKVYGSDMRYSDHNEVIGVLNCILLEFYRRSTAPYEDKKIKEEGDL